MEKIYRLQCGTPKDFPESLHRVEASGVATYRGYNLVINDKDNDLFVFDTKGAYVTAISGTVFGGLRKFEDISVDGDWIYLVGDYKNKQNGETLEDHSIGFRFQLGEEPNPSLWKIKNLFPFHLEMDGEHGWSADPTTNRMKVEGLSVTHQDVYVGVRESALMKEGQGEVIVLKSKKKLDLNSDRISFNPYLRFQTSVLPGTPVRPLRISGLGVNVAGGMLILLSAQSDSKWPQKNKTREERFAGNQVYYWSLSGGDVQSPFPLPPLPSQNLFPGYKAEGIVWEEGAGLGPLGAFKMVFDNEGTLSQGGWPSASVSCTITLK